MARWLKRIFILICMHQQPTSHQTVTSIHMHANTAMVAIQTIQTLNSTQFGHCIPPYPNSRINCGATCVFRKTIPNSTIQYTQLGRLRCMRASVWIFLVSNSEWIHFNSHIWIRLAPVGALNNSTSFFDRFDTVFYIAVFFYICSKRKVEREKNSAFNFFVDFCLLSKRIVGVFIFICIGKLVIPRETFGDFDC